MGLHVPPDIHIEPAYSISYKKGGQTIAVSAPNLDDVKILFDYAAQKVGLIEAP